MIGARRLELCNYELVLTGSGKRVFAQEVSPFRVGVKFDCVKCSVQEPKC